MSVKSFSRTREARSKGREAFPEEAFSSSSPQAFLAQVFRELVRAAPPSGIIQWRRGGDRAHANAPGSAKRERHSVETRALCFQG